MPNRIMSRRVTLSFSLDELIVSTIDDTRGEIPRSRFVEKALLKFLGEQND